MFREALEKELNSPNVENRLEALAKLRALSMTGAIPEPKKTGFVNNHIHTSYSFSPYSPTKAVYMAWQSGLATAGIMDHDSLSGAKEFIEAARIVDLPVTVGMECRAFMQNTELCGRRINNPDQKSIAYVAIHGIPHQNIETLNIFFRYYRIKRNDRNRKMCARITELTAPYGITLNFENDVLPLSMAHEGGSITERHILYALTKKITARCKTPEEVLRFLISEMGIDVSEKVRGQILAAVPEYYEYDILGALKSNLVEKFYVDAYAECPDIYELEKVVNDAGAILAYAYLGDVGDSVTGDKKTQKFEDDYLDSLFREIARIGFNAVTYMPSRNTESQLRRIMNLCEKYKLFQISGEDINSPRQSFHCQAMQKDMFRHLADAAYALIGHEKCATENAENSMFSHEIRHRMPTLDERIEYFASKVR